MLAFSPLATGIERIRERDPEDALGTVAQAEGKTRAQVALQWCLAQSAVIAIFKAEKVEHVRENCSASGGTLSADHRHLLDSKIRARSRNRLERVARRFARRALQLAGRDLGA